MKIECDYIIFISIKKKFFFPASCSLQRLAKILISTQLFSESVDKYRVYNSAQFCYKKISKIEVDVTI